MSTPSGKKIRHRASPGKIVNPHTLIVHNSVGLETADPHCVSDNLSLHLVSQIYEGLIYYEGPYTDKFVPVLSTAVPSVNNGLVSSDGRIYSFPIRRGVKFHSGNKLTPQDVEFSFKRLMVLGRTSALFVRAFLGLDSIYDQNGDILDNVNLEGKEMVLSHAMDKAVRAETNEVVFRLARPYLPFLQLMTRPLVLDRNEVVRKGGWRGFTDDVEKDMAIVRNYHGTRAVRNTEFSNAGSGTGPFRLGIFGERAVLERNNGYWNEGRRAEKLWSGEARLERVVIEHVPMWESRFQALKSGNADIISIAPSCVPVLSGTDGVRTIENLPSIGADSILFNFDVTLGKNHEGPIGSGRIRGNGVPANFFSDSRIRSAFCAAFDSQTFIQEFQLGRGYLAATPIVQGVPYHDPKVSGIGFNLSLATKLLRDSMPRLWDRGFYLQAFYPSGSMGGLAALTLLKSNLRQLNPRFEISLREVSSWNEYQNLIREGVMPLYTGAVRPAVIDPDSFIRHWMHSGGLFSGPNKIRLLQEARIFDDLIEEGASSTHPTRRQEIYSKLQKLFVAQSIAIMRPVAYRAVAQRAWVDGWYFNLYTGADACPPLLTSLDKKMRGAVDPRSIDLYGLEVRTPS